MKVLIAEDEPISRHMLSACLTKAGYEVVVVCDGIEACRVLQSEDAPRFAILDWVMPGMDGLEVCRAMRQRAAEPYTYILLLTARDQTEQIVAGMDAGADDYIVKPFKPEELQARMRAGKRILDLHETLRHQAYHDSLTGLFNRKAILDALERELSRARRESAPVGVIMADLDHFKRINDEHGHAAGDAVLREAARRMQAALRSYDSLGRYGGEEFLVVLPGCDGARALQLAGRIRECIRSESVAIGSVLVPLRMCLGVAVCTDPDNTEIEALLQEADSALYQAKNGGRDQVQLAGSARGGY